MKTEKTIDTSSKEYVEWASKVWRMNDERNKKIFKEQTRMQLMDDIASMCSDYDEQ